MNEFEKWYDNMYKIKNMDVSFDTFYRLEAPILEIFIV
jgi:hypothetical protein